MKPDKTKVKNFNLLTKAEILWLENHFCKHGHRYTEHRHCFIAEDPELERIGFFDIESGLSLTADFGYLFSYCIKELDGPIIKNCIKPSEMRNDKIRDKRLVQDLCKDFHKFDVLVVYYGCDKPMRHDFPFARTRALKWGIGDFPKQKEKKVIDVYDIAKTKLKLARRRAVDVGRILGVEYKGEPVNPDIWQSASSGNPKALARILKHNEEDVIMLEKIWKILQPYKDYRISL